MGRGRKPCPRKVGLQGLSLFNDARFLLNLSALFLLPRYTFNRTGIYRLLAVTGVTSLGAYDVCLAVVLQLEDLGTEGFTRGASITRIIINNRYFHLFIPP